MSDEPFEPRIGRMRAPRSKRGRRYLDAVLVAAMRAGFGHPKGRRGFAGSRIGRGAAAARLLGSRDRYAGSRVRRAVVKTRLVRLGSGGRGAAVAHLRYIQRDGVGRDGGTGELYAAREDAADGNAFVARCAGDRHQFRLIVSAEDGAEYADLRPLIRRFMARMEQDLGTALDWVAADHADTLHPHTHVILRGKDEHGGNLVIAPEYIAHGMRERIADLVTLDLGPRSDREIEARRRLDVGAERLTVLDRQLMRRMDDERTVSPGGGSMVDRALLAGRLRKLEALGLADRTGNDRWRLADGIEATLRALGERGDILRTMQRALGASRADAEQRIYDPASGEPLVGRVLARGLGDEHRDRHFVLVDALDGRAHYVDIGIADAIEPLPAGAIVRVVPRAAGGRASDRTVAAIASVGGGRYSAELHRAADPRATDAFIAAHIRRLEALRRPLALERESDGVWRLGEDFLARVERHEGRLATRQPVAIEILSPVPLEPLAQYDGATWLDRVIASDADLPSREAGFGREVRAALALRRAWLLREGLAIDQGGRLSLRTGALAALQRRELLRVTADIARETGGELAEPGEGERIRGTLRRRIDLASGRFALVDDGHAFALVPWRPVLARAIGKPVSGIVREAGISWTIASARSIER